MVSSPDRAVHKARMQNRKKQQAHHVTPKENIKYNSKKRRLKMEKDNSLKE
jgi:hypothetical protein